jgi:acyl transferase domain-containing protein
MGRALYEHNSVFRHAMERCATLCDPHLPQPLLEVLYPATTDSGGAPPLTRPIFTLPAVFAVEYSLYTLCAFDAVEPYAVIGHSLGEFVAAVAAGVLRLETALALVCARALSMDALPATGSMVSLKASAASARAAIASCGASSGVAVAAVNGPLSCVLSGAEDAIAAVLAALPPDTKSTPVNASHADRAGLALDPSTIL